MSSHTLARDGDDFEKAYWAAFASADFTSYADVWELVVKPLREDPGRVELRDSDEGAEEDTEKRIVVAELNYSTLLHLGRVWEIRQSPESFLAEPTPSPIALARRLNRLYGAFTSAIIGLSSATDTADELLERMVNARYEPWSEKASDAARREWRRKTNPLANLHRYRNRLVHGPALPSRHGLVAGMEPRRVTVAFPKLGLQTEHLDWRDVQHGRAQPSDFDAPSDLVAEVWTSVLEYLESQWRSTLVPLMR